MHALVVLMKKFDTVTKILCENGKYGFVTFKKAMVALTMYCSSDLQIITSVTSIRFDKYYLSYIATKAGNGPFVVYINKLPVPAFHSCNKYFLLKQQKIFGVKVSIALKICHNVNLSITDILYAARIS